MKKKKDFETEKVAALILLFHSVVYDHPTVIQNCVAVANRGFDCLSINSQLRAPILFDTDAEVGWVKTGNAASTVSAYQSTQLN